MSEPRGGLAGKAELPGATARWSGGGGGLERMAPRSAPRLGCLLRTSYGNLDFVPGWALRALVFDGFGGGFGPFIYFYFFGFSRQGFLCVVLIVLELAI